MCSPISLGVAMAGMSLYSASAQQKAQKSQAQAEADNARNAQIADLNAQEEKMQQISSQAGDAKLQRRREALRERASMRVANAGANGNTIDRLFNTSTFNENFDNGTITNNWKNAQAQTQRETEKINITAQGRINNANTSYANAGSSSRLLISGIQGGLQGYSLGRSFK